MMAQNCLWEAGALLPSFTMKAHTWNQVDSIKRDKSRFSQTHFQLSNHHAMKCKKLLPEQVTTLVRARLETVLVFRRWETFATYQCPVQAVSCSASCVCKRSRLIFGWESHILQQLQCSARKLCYLQSMMHADGAESAYAAVVSFSTLRSIWYLLQLHH